MKSVGIITILKCNNYGAELQAFALQRKLILMGYDAQIIDYLFYKNKGYKKEKASAPFYPFPSKKRLKEYVLPLWEYLKSLPNSKAAKERGKRFADFHANNTSFSVKTYHSFSELYDNPPRYDVYCVGSDQVWNPNCYTSLYPYFLTFAPSGSKKISYASSFGVSNLPATAVPVYAKCLHGLDKIGVREDTGKELVKKITGKEATTVVDPTLLLTQEEWHKVAATDLIPQKDYILLYVLKDSNYITTEALKMGKEKGLKVVRLCKGAFRQDSKETGIIDIMNAGPSDFIGLFAHAKIIFTNSFHGTAFSTIFQKDFYSILPQGRDNNSRIVDFLASIGNTDRIMFEGKDFKEKEPIDWSSVNGRLHDFVEQSELYLYEAIGE